MRRRGGVRVRGARAAAGLATGATAGRTRGATGALAERTATTLGARLTGGFRAGAFRATLLTTLLATFLTALAALFTALAAGLGRLAVARADLGALRRRVTAFRAGWRLAFAEVFARVLGDFFDFLDFAALVARLGPAARRLFARPAFALAMTLLGRSPLVQEAIGCRAAV